MKRYILAALYLILNTTLFAQEFKLTQNIPLPPGEILLRAPAFSQWVITYKYPEDETKKTPSPNKTVSTPLGGGLAKPRQVTVTKTDHIVHDLTVDVFQRQMERWSDGKFQVSSIQGVTGHLILAMDSPFITFVTNYDKADFQGLEWISRESYTGVTKIDGVDCLVFQRDTPAEDYGPSSNPELPANATMKPLPQSSHQIAYINLATRLPLRLVLASEQRDYKFMEAPSSLQKIPPEFQLDIDNLVEATKKLTTPAPRPY